MKDNPSLLVLKSDKSSKVVLMEKQDYIQLMENRLNNNFDYKDIHKQDPTTRIQTEYNELSTTLHRKKQLTDIIGTIKLYKLE